MGGPFRAIVGGQASYRWAFPPAQAIRVNNHTTQYGHLIEIDEFVAPGQLGLVIPLENPLAGITFKFEAPPQASQAAPTATQVCLVNTYDVAEVGVSIPPLGPDPGLLLPIGLDSPQHLHHHTNVHHHATGGETGHSHNHSHGGATGGESQVHNHTVVVNNNGGVPSGAQVFYDGVNFNANSVGGGVFSGNESQGHTHSIGADATGSSGHTHGNTSDASPGDSDLENVQHTHP